VGDVDEHAARESAQAAGGASAHRLDVTDPASFAAFLDTAEAVPVPARRRAVREQVLRALGVTRIAGDVDAEARRAYHERAFGR
jgi:hypothetical protein